MGHTGKFGLIFVANCQSALTGRHTERFGWLVCPPLGYLVRLYPLYSWAAPKYETPHYLRQALAITYSSQIAPATVVEILVNDPGLTMVKY